MQDDIVIVSAARTPVGAFNGAFANLPAHELGKVAIKAALERAGVEGRQVSEVIMGQILTAAQGQNPARQASIAAGIPVESPAWGVNQLCGSGLRSVALGYQALLMLQLVVFSAAAVLLTTKVALVILGITRLTVLRITARWLILAGATMAVVNLGWMVLDLLQRRSRA